MEAFELVWDKITTQFSDWLTPLPQPVSLTNPTLDKEYKLTHRLVSSSYAFKATDNYGAACFVKVMTCESFSHLQAIYKQIDSLGQALSDSAVPVIDKFEFLRQGHWGVVLVSPWLTTCTVNELVSCAGPSQLEKDTCLLLFTRIHSLAEEAKRKGCVLKCLYPSSLLLVESGSYSELSWGSRGFRVVCSLTDRWTHGYAADSPWKGLHPDEASWAPLCCLLTLTGDGSADSEPATCKDVALRFEDPAIRYLLEHGLKSDAHSRSVIRRMIKGWKGMLTQELTEVQLITLKEVQVLHSGMTMVNLGSRLLALNKLLDLAPYGSESVARYLIEHQLERVFFELVGKVDWLCSSNVAAGYLCVLNSLGKNPRIRPLIRELGLFHNLFPNVTDPTSLHLVVDTAAELCENNTLTVFQRLAEVLEQAKGVARDHTNIEDCIRNTAHFYGPASVDYIIGFGVVMGDSDSRILEHLVEVPHYFKLKRLEKLMHYITEVLERKRYTNAQAPDILKAIVFLLADVFFMPKLLDEAANVVQCPVRNQLFFWAKLGHLRLLKKCHDCGASMCLVCCEAHHSTHETEYLYYQNDYQQCQVQHEHPRQLPLGLVLLPTYKERPHFVDSLGQEYRELLENTFSGSEGNEVRLLNALSKKPNESFYFEVELIDSGSRESIVFFEEESGLAYHTQTGVVTLQGERVLAAPRVGSFDTIGIGVAYGNLGFITYNGMLVYPFIPNVHATQLKPGVRFYGLDCQVKLKLGDWMFRRKPDLKMLESPHSRSNVLMLLDKAVNKLKNRQEGCYSMYQELARELGIDFSLKGVKRMHTSR